MSNTLSKDVLFYKFFPEPILEYHPAYSYIDYIQSSIAQTTRKITVNPTKTLQPGKNETVLVTGNKPGESLTIPGQQSSGGYTIKVIINVPASYTIYIPEPIIKEQNLIGWNGSAISKEYFINYGEASFSIDSSSVGVMAGLTTTNNAVKDSGYTNISYAILGNLGKYIIYIQGQPIAMLPVSFTSSDVFKIVVGSANVSFFLNQIPIYSLSCVPELSTYRLDTSLFCSYDKVLNASIKQIFYPTIGVHTLQYFIIKDGIKYSIVNNVLEYKNIKYKVISSGYVYINNILYLVQNNKIFFDSMYFTVINKSITVDGIYGGTYPINYLPIVLINNKVYSVQQELLVNNINYFNGYFNADANSKIISKDFSSISTDINVYSNIKPYYGLTSLIVTKSSLLYHGGSYIQNNIDVQNYIVPNYGIVSDVHIANNLYYKGYSFINSTVVTESELLAGELILTIPPRLTNLVETGSYIRDYFIEDPSLFIIT